MVRKIGDLIFADKCSFWNYDETPLIYLGTDLSHTPSVQWGRKLFVLHSQENRIERIEEKLLDRIERKYDT